MIPSPAVAAIVRRTCPNPRCRYPDCRADDTCHDAEEDAAEAVAALEAEGFTVERAA
jgi:hypothetical protein